MLHCSVVASVHPAISLELEKTVPGRGGIDCIILTRDLDLQSPTSYGHDLHCTHVQKFKVNGQSALKIKCKQTDGQTNGGDCITSLPNAICNKDNWRGRNLIGCNKLTS